MDEIKTFIVCEIIYDILQNIFKKAVVFDFLHKCSLLFVRLYIVVTLCVSFIQEHWMRLYSLPNHYKIFSNIYVYISVKYIKKAH